jgi:hypothetical protein
VHLLEDLAFREHVFIGYCPNGLRETHEDTVMPKSKAARCIQIWGS